MLAVLNKTKKNRINPLRLDPSRTTMLRRRYMIDMNGRFRDLKRAINELIVEQDVFGLIKPKPFTVLVEKQAWKFLTDSDKITSFNKWFKTQADAKLLQVDITGDPWSATYVHSAYKKGAIRAYTDSHAEEFAESLDFYAGSRHQFLMTAFNQPEMVSKLRLLATRSFEELKGISAVMSQQLSRTLADGLAQGQGADAIARSIRKNITSINRKRALVLARTEIVSAHAEGQLDSFELLGIDEIGVMAEWSTSGKPCTICEPLEGTIMTVAEARGLITRHPNCKCAWIPANVGEKKAGRAWTKKQKETRIDKSIKAEAPKKSLKEAKKKSTWAGKEKTFKTPSKTLIEKAKEILP